MPGEIADLIREYAAHSRGRIRFIQRDPDKANLLGVVEDLGIVPQQIHVVERNETTVALVYSGILIEYLDRQMVIPVVFSLDTLEYDLSSRIRSLVRNTERELGIIVADAHKQWNTEYGFLNRELFRSGFRVRLINPGDEIPDTLPALFVLGGAEDLEEDQLRRLDLYIQGGGNVLFALDGVFVDTRGNLDARAVQDQGLLAILANYGVIVRQNLVLDRAALNLTFQTQIGNSITIRTIRYPQWIGVQGQGGNPNHPLTTRFQGLDLYWASPLVLSPPPGISAEVLFSSTAHAWLQTERLIANPHLLHLFDEEIEQTMGTKVLGASLSGIFPGAFEDRPEHQKRPSRLIVVGDSDFAGNFMQASRAEERNLDFLVKAAEWLSSDDDLIAIRSRDRMAGRLDRITNREERDTAMTFSRRINTIVIPAGVVLIGIFVTWRRKARTAKERGLT
jgi:ABC-type uncharacterized transport system involved in gliding motility auxiliary subunit